MAIVGAWQAQCRGAQMIRATGGSGEKATRSTRFDEQSSSIDSAIAISILIEILGSHRDHFIYLSYLIVLTFPYLVCHMTGLMISVRIRRGSARPHSDDARIKCGHAGPLRVRTFEVRDH